MPRFSPQLTNVWFGDGAQAKAVKIIPSIRGTDGQMETEFHLLPSWEMKQYYGLDDRYRNKEGFIVVRFLSADVLPLNLDPTINTVMVMSDLNCGDTPFTRGYPDKKLIDDHVNENRILRSIVAKLEEEKIKALERLDIEMDQDVKIILTSRKAGKDLYQMGLVPGYSQGTEEGGS